MNKFRFTIKVLAIAIFTLAFATMTQAQATRTWVSGVGDDVNPCSRTAPCKTFAGAISKTAVDGEIDALDPGGFGAVTITKAITIDGSATGLASILGSGVVGAVTVNITASSGSNFVQLRSLSINGSGTTFGQNGVRIVNGVAGMSVSVENCVIWSFRAGNGRGISDERTQSGKLYVEDTIIKNNSASGAVIIPGGGATVNAVFTNVRFESNGGSGVGAEPNTKVTANNCVAVNNGGKGFVAEGAASAELNLNNCVSSHNATGVAANGGATTRMSNTIITNNPTLGVDFSGGGTVVTFGNCSITANGGGAAGNTPNGTPIAQQ
ncbi:MAG: hypothetical protein QOH70_829 [Blastocatellia bacterium]|jgi:hypothetical protein|nr:hypothetical protein [Blastocatellia bacterium]